MDDIKTQDIDYRPGLVGRFARILIPILQGVLPAAAFRKTYDFLYWLNKRRIAVLYGLLMLIKYPFSSKHTRMKKSLTLKLLPYTMDGWKALENAFDVVDIVNKNSIEGVIVECGVAQGGTAAMLALADISTTKTKPRKCWFFDSYEGLPEPTDDDYIGTKAGDYIQPLVKGSCLGTLEQVGGLLFGKLGLPKERITLVKGWFQDTAPEYKDKLGPISILRLDGDWYDSTKIPLENFYPSLMSGGCVIIDDYATCYGSRKAVDEFLNENSIDVRLNPDGRGGAWFVKP